LPTAEYFKPRGIPFIDLEEVVLTVDEYETLKLADYEQLYQEQAAEKMHVSRQTFGRIILSAHYKLADALIHGKALKIEGGEFAIKKSPPGKCKHSTIHAEGNCPQCSRRIKNNKYQKGSL
jgi:predicted DNA-binding protein (UPF0251 family)